MFSSPTKPSNSPNQDQATSLKNTVNQPGNPSFSKNSPYPEKSRSEIPNNNNPEHVPAYMNSMKIVPSPSFNFAATVGADTTLNVNTQPKNTSYNQSLRTVETSDKLITPEQKITSTKSVKYEIRNENESSKLNKSNSIPVSNEPEKSPQESLISKKQGNSTEANSNASPDNPEISSDAKVVNTKQNTESTKITVTKTSTVAVREPLLDSDRSDIPLNIQMLKQKFKDQEAKLAKADDREEAKNSKANNQAQMANGSRPQTREEELKKEKTKNDPNKMDTYIQNAGKQTDGQSNWLYKKFTEAELVKKEESSRKSETAQNERNEDVKTKVVTEQNVKGNNPRNTQESGHFIEKIRSPAGYSRPGTEAERAKKSAHVPQEGSNQLQLDKTKFMQFAQTQGNQYKEQRGYVQDTSLNVSQSDIAPPSRDPMITSGGLETSQIMKMGNWQQGGQIDFSAMGMHQMNPQEQQKKTLQIIGFYEQHLNNFKGLIIQQTNVIEAQKLKISSLDNLLKEANDKLKVFEQELYNQAMSHQKAHQELLLKYSETVSQLDRTQTDLEKALKKLGELSLTGNTGDTSKRQASETGSPPRKHEKGKDNLNALYKEISSIKKDLDMQREIMKEIKYSTPTKRERESKGEDLRKSVNGSDYEQTKDECDLVYPLGTPYERHSTGSGLQRKSTSTSVPRLGHRNRSPDIQYEKDESRGRLNRSPFPIEEQMEENARSLNQSKQRSQGTRVRDLLNWQTPAKKRDQESASPNKSSIAFRVDTTNSMDNDANLTCERKTNNRSSSIDANSLSKSCMVDYSSNKKPQKNPEEIEKLQQLIRDLYHEKKSVEETLLHIPENWKTLEQRRKKAKIEAEIEKIEEKMEEYKKRLRDLTGSPVKQRRCAG